LEELNNKREDFNMSRNIKDQVSESSVKNFIIHYLNCLEKEGLTLFQGMPTIQAFPKRTNLIGLVLLNDNNTDIKYEFVKDPRYGEDYLFISVEELKNESMLEELGENYAYSKLNHLRADNAYNVNLDRVKNLIENNHYAIALVFLVSAFENITRDLFFNYSDIWFIKDDDFYDKVYKKVGIHIDPNIPNPKSIKYFSKFREINDDLIGIRHTDLDIAEKWHDTIYWENIHKICEELRVYDEYILKKQGNKGMEIGNFEILKAILEKQSKEMKVLNFQRIFKKGGIKNLFEMFYSIKLDGFNNSFKLISDYIKMRHAIIHGTLKDNQIDEYAVSDFRSLIKKLVSYLRDELDRKQYENLTWGVQ